MPRSWSPSTRRPNGLGLRVAITLAQARAMHPRSQGGSRRTPAADAQLLTADPPTGVGATRRCARARSRPDGVLLDIAGCAPSVRRRSGADRRPGRRASPASALPSASASPATATPAAAWAARGSALPPAAPVDRALAERARSARRRCRCKRCVSPRRPRRACAASASSASAIFSTWRARRLPPASAADLLRQLDRALGREREPLQPLLPVAPYVAEQPFAEPITREEDVLATAERLAQRLSAMLERRGEGMRRLELELFRTDGQVLPHRRRHLAPDPRRARGARAAQRAAGGLGRSARSRLRLRSRPAQCGRSPSPARRNRPRWTMRTMTTICTV